MSKRREPRLAYAAKVLLALRVWRSYVRVRRSVTKTPLPQLVRELKDEGAGATPPHHTPQLLSHAVFRSLRVGRHQPRCLIGALILFRLLRQQGDAPVLVIGLPPEAADNRAHAWIELDGLDVGPPPGKGRHEALARFS